MFYHFRALKSAVLSFLHDSSPRRIAMFYHSAPSTYIANLPVLAGFLYMHLAYLINLRGEKREKKREKKEKEKKREERRRRRRRERGEEEKKGGEDECFY